MPPPTMVTSVKRDSQMKTHDPENERIKRRYFTYLKEAKRFGEPSIDAVAKALNRFETYTRMKPFNAFHVNQAIGFKKHLSVQRNRRDGADLSKATIYSTLMALRNFHHWLAGQPGFRARLTYSDADYFNPSGVDTAVAKARRERPAPSLAQVEHLLRLMPEGTEVEIRNRAVVAFVILTGARDGAVSSMKLRHVDIPNGRVFQDARDVKTKFRKTFTTTFFPVGDLPRAVVEAWVKYLENEKLWGPDDPLFPATRVVLNKARHFEAAGLDRKHWTNATPIREIFKTACAGAGLPYFNPHSFRSTLVTLGERRCRTPEEFKAWSQNLGHEKVMTTFSSYGAIAPDRQADLIRNLALAPEHSAEMEEAARRLVALARRQ